jgi:hypothetical protein
VAHCMHLLGLLSIFGAILEGAHVETFHLLFWELTTSFLVERSIKLALCTFVHGFGCLEIFTCGLVACILWTTCDFGMLVMEHSPRRIIILFSHSCILEGALSELF